MIDLHTHVLGGIDDGPASMAESCELAIAAFADGSEILAATPHIREDFPRVRLEEIGPRCEQLEQALPAHRKPSIVGAGEVDLLWGCTAARRDLEKASYGQHGTDLLVETPDGPLFDQFEELLFRISAQGFRVLLAHPERNPTFHRDPKRLGALAARGVLLQITGRSLTRLSNKSPAFRLAVDLIKEGVAHVIASDAHAIDWRPPRLSSAVASAAKVAPRRAEWMVTDVPAAILAGEALPPAPRENGGRRRWRLWQRKSRIVGDDR